MRFLPILLFFLTTVAGAQPLQLSLSIDPQPSPEILEWSAQPMTVQGTVLNTGTTTIDFRIQAEIRKAGVAVIRTKPANMMTFTLAPGEMITAFAEDVIPPDLSSVDILDNGLYNTVLTTGKLPADFYEICVELFNADDPSDILSLRQCRTFIITDYQPPVLLSPVDNANLALNTSGFMFQWSPVTPAVPGVEYEFRLVEKIGFQTPPVTFQSGIVLEEETVNTTSLFYGPAFSPLLTGRTYVWSVRARDAVTGEIFGEDNGQNGWAEPYVFTIPEVTEPETESESEGECTATFDKSSIEITSRTETAWTTNIWLTPDYDGSKYVVSSTQIISTNLVTGGVILDTLLSGLPTPFTYTFLNQNNNNEKNLKVKLEFIVNLTALNEDDPVCDPLVYETQETFFKKNTCEDAGVVSLNVTRNGNQITATAVPNVTPKIKNYIWHFSDGRDPVKGKKENPITFTANPGYVNVEVSLELKGTTCTPNASRTVLIPGSEEEDIPEEEGNCPMTINDLTLTATPNDETDNYTVELRADIDTGVSLAEYVELLTDFTLDGETKTTNGQQSAYFTTAKDGVVAAEVTAKLKYKVFTGTQAQTRTCTLRLQKDLLIDPALTPCINDFQVKSERVEDSDVDRFKFWIQSESDKNYRNLMWTIQGQDFGEADTLDRGFHHRGTYKVCALYEVQQEDGSWCDFERCKTKIIKPCQFVECKPECDVLSPRSWKKDDVIQLCDQYEMRLTEDPTGSSAALSGKGAIWVPWLNTEVEVTFSGISVNANDQMCSGKVHTVRDEEAPTWPEQWGINQVLTHPWTISAITDLDAWVKSELPGLAGSIPSLPGEAAKQVKPIKMPWGINRFRPDEDSPEQGSVILTALVWTPERNTFAALAGIDFDDDEVYDFGLQGHNITFDYRGPVNPVGRGGTGGLSLLAEQVISYKVNAGDPDEDVFRIILNPPRGSELGTGVDWKVSCTGELVDWCFRLDADFEMPRRWFLPVPDTGEKVRSNVQTEVCNWQDWLVTTNLPRCELTGLRGHELRVSRLSYDHSRVRNVPGIKFPANYGKDKTVSFEGFTLQEAKLVFPAEISTYSDDRRLEVQMNNWIIHRRHGVTGQLAAKNLINFPDGNFADLGGSIDNIKLDMVNGQFTTAYMDGKLLLPLTDDSPSNSITWTSLLGTGNQGKFEGYKFTMKPDDTLRSEFFGGADLEIYQTSTLELLLKYRHKSFDLVLNGRIDLPDEVNNPLGNGTIPINFDKDFQGMGIHWLNTKTQKKFALVKGTWSLASPQKTLFRFPVTLDNFTTETGTPTGNQLFVGGFGFDATVGLAQNRIGGKTHVRILGAISRPPGQRLQPTFAGISVDDIHIHADLAAVKMEGIVSFISDDPIYGDGAGGTLEAQFKCLNTGLSASAFFGNTDYRASSRYRYWKAEAAVVLPPPGLPFLPGLAFRGFGAGAYHHMTADFNGVSVNPSAASNSVNTGATFTPDPNTEFGFNAKAVIAGTPKEESFNADATLTGEFTQSAGMSLIRFDGDFYAGAGLQNRSEALLNGSLFVQYDFPAKLFDLGATVSIDKDPISTPSPFGLSMRVDGKRNKWYFKAGEPGNTNLVRVGGVTVEEYLMFGNDIQPPTGFTSRTRSGYRAATGSYPGNVSAMRSMAVNSNSLTGKGFAFGLGAAFNSGIKTKQIAGRIRARYAFRGGFEVNAALMQYDPSYGCGGFTPVGMGRGWRVRGNVAAWASADIGLGISCGLGCGCNNNPGGCYRTIFGLGLGAWLHAQFPRPTYLAGGVNGRYNVLGGILKGNFRADFNVGTSCGGTVLGGNTPLVAEDQAEEQRDALIQSVSLAQLSGRRVSTTETFTVVYGYAHDEVFDVAEMQNDGTVQNRTFKVLYETELLENGTTPVPLKQRVSLDGSYEYWHNTSIDTGSAFNNQQTGINPALGGVSPTGNNSAANSNPATSQPDNNQAIGVNPNTGNSSLGTNTPTNQQSSGITTGNPSSLSGLGSVSANNMNGGIMLGQLSGPPIDGGAGYDNLPPPPPAVYGRMKSGTGYTFRVSGRLYEYKGTAFVPAKNSRGQDVSETRSYTFLTEGSIPSVSTGTINNNSGQPATGLQPIGN